MLWLTPLGRFSSSKNIHHMVNDEITTGAEEVSPVTPTPEETPEVEAPEVTETPEGEAVEVAAV